MIKTEDSLAKTKLQELVTARRPNPNQSWTERRLARLVALQTFNLNFMKEFMFWLR